MSGIADARELWLGRKKLIVAFLGGRVILESVKPLSGGPF
jgi:hypothetical protein